MLYALITEQITDGEKEYYFYWWMSGKDEDSIVKKIERSMDAVYGERNDPDIDDEGELEDPGPWEYDEYASADYEYKIFRSKLSLTKELLRKTEMKG